MKENKKLHMPDDRAQPDAAPRWRRTPERRPDDILDGALTEFQARGFSRARIEDIARHADLSKGTVYLYFDSKEEMLKALVRRSVNPIAEALVKLGDHMTEKQHCSSADTLKGMLYLAGSKLSEPKISSIPLLIISEAGSFPELVQTYRNEVIEVIMKTLIKVISRGVESGEFRAIDPYLAIRSLMGIIIMQVIWNGIFIRPDEPPVNIEKLLQSHLDLFLNGALAVKKLKPEK